MNRRNFLAACVAAIGVGTVLGTTIGEAGPVRRHRRRVRRRIRRRHRRRVAIRMMFGRPFWVVPVALAVGWELVHEDRVVVVKEVKVVERDHTKIEVAVVQHTDGKTQEIEMVREDNDGNKQELEGSAIPDDDKKTPGVEAEVEAED